MYKIYTTADDARKIQASEVFHSVSDIITTEIIIIEDETFDRLQTMTNYQIRAIEAANKEGATLIFLTPDSVWSNGTFATIVQLAEQGYRVVLIAGIRVTHETFVPALIEKYFSQEDRTISVSSGSLVKLGLEHLHLHSKACFLGTDYLSTWPSHLYWPVKGEGILARCFHLHPLMIYPQRTDVSPKSTIDDDYIALACPNIESIYVIQDSDEAFGVDITDKSRHIGDISNFDLARVIAWAYYHTNKQHHYYANHHIALHIGKKSGNWKNAIRASNKVINKIDRLTNNRIRSFSDLWLFIQYKYKWLAYFNPDDDIDFVDKFGIINDNYNLLTNVINNLSATPFTPANMLIYLGQRFITGGHLLLRLGYFVGRYPVHMRFMLRQFMLRQFNTNRTRKTSGAECMNDIVIQFNHDSNSLV